MLKYLKHPEAATRHRACFVLAQIGTEQSLAELRKLRRDRAMGRSAQEAYDIISQRQRTTEASQASGDTQPERGAPQEPQE